jgi:hypothetical protein
VPREAIPRHSDPRITTEVYGHLVPDYMRAEIDRLSFGLKPPRPTSKDSRSVAGSASEFGPPVVQASQDRPQNAIPDLEDVSDSEVIQLWARRDSNPLPPASEATGDAAWQFSPAQNI